MDIDLELCLSRYTQNADATHLSLVHSEGYVSSAADMSPQSRSSQKQSDPTLNGTSASGYIESCGYELTVRSNTLPLSVATPILMARETSICLRRLLRALQQVGQSHRQHHIDVSWKLGYELNSPTPSMRYGCVRSMWAGRCFNHVEKTTAISIAVT